MLAVTRALLALMVSSVRSRVSLQMEIVPLRPQLAVYQRSLRRPRVRPSDRMLWAWLARHWSHWRAVRVVVQPATVIGWQRTRFRDQWARLSHSRPGRPRVSPARRPLIRDIATANPRWGSPRIRGELRKLGIAVAKSTVEQYRGRRRRPASPTWRTFLQTHVAEIVAFDCFTVPTVRFQVRFVLIVLAHARRRMLHCTVTAHPTAPWTAQQLVEALPWDSAPRALLRDREGVSGQVFPRRVVGLGMEAVLPAPQSPWQNPDADRLLGSIRRECLEHVLIFSADHCRRVLARYLVYYHRWRPHLSLAMDAPDRRPVQFPDQGAVVAVPEVGGLHHHYERKAA